MESLKYLFAVLGVIGSLLLLLSILQFIVILILFFSKKMRLYKILQKNLSKQISIVLPNNSDECKMENEIQSLDNKIFTTAPNIKTSYSNFKSSEKIGLVIIGYKKDTVDFESFKSLLNEIGKKTPIIFYTYRDNNAFYFRDGTEDKFAIHLNQYDNYLIDNFPLKLIGDVYSILSIYKSQ